jgi:ABC-type uncharacterized transport system permease subunit
MDLLIIVISTLMLAAPLAYAAMGGLTSERSGVINIGLEGLLLISCVVTAVVGVRSGNPALGLAAGVGASILLSLIHLVLTQTYRIDQIVSGMAINALAYGASNYLDRKLLATGTNSMPLFFGGQVVNLAGYEIPLGSVIYLVVALGIPFGIWWALRRTRWGLQVLAVGNEPDKSRQMGVSPWNVRLKALILTGVFCGFGGAMLVTTSGSFVDQMTAGRGFIALAALILGGWRPMPALVACLAFGFFEALQLRLQGTSMMGATLPPEFWKSLPYLATLLAMAGFLGRNRPPASLGKL